MLKHWGLIAAAACTLVFADNAAAKPRIRIAGVSVGFGYSNWGGYPYYASPFYDPYFASPFLYGFAPWYFPGYWGGFAYQPYRGEVKLSANLKSGDLYIDGGYAGDVRKLRSMWLDPGAYQVEIRDGGQTTFERRIYVLGGRSVKLRAMEGRP
jgi:hypothetical protein